MSNEVVFVAYVIKAKPLIEYKKNHATIVAKTSLDEEKIVWHEFGKSIMKKVRKLFDCFSHEQGLKYIPCVSGIQTNLI